MTDGVIATHGNADLGDRSCGFGRTDRRAAAATGRRSVWCRAGDAHAAGVPRSARRGRRASVQRTGGVEHRLVRVPGPRGTPQRPGGVGLRDADGAQRRPRLAPEFAGARCRSGQLGRPPTTFASQPNDSASRRTCQPLDASGTASLPWPPPGPLRCWSPSSSPPWWSGCASPTRRRPRCRPASAPTRQSAVPPTSKPRPESQDASCPDVQLLSIPGTWESSPQMDPLNPTQFPIALLLNVTNPIRDAFGADRVGRVHGSVHRPVPQSVLRGQADVLQRQPRRGHPRRRRGADQDERRLPADQLRDRRLLAGRGDRRGHRQRHRQRPWARRR